MSDETKRMEWISSIRKAQEKRRKEIQRVCLAVRLYAWRTNEGVLHTDILSFS